MTAFQFGVAQLEADTRCASSNRGLLGVGAWDLGFVHAVQFVGILDVPAGQRPLDRTARSDDGLYHLEVHQHAEVTIPPRRTSAPSPAPAATGRGHDRGPAPLPQLLNISASDGSPSGDQAIQLLRSHNGPNRRQSIDGAGHGPAPPQSRHPAAEGEGHRRTHLCHRPFVKRADAPPERRLGHCVKAISVDRAAAPETGSPVGQLDFDGQAANRRCDLRHRDHLSHVDHLGPCKYEHRSGLPADLRSPDLSAVHGPVGMRGRTERITPCPMPRRPPKMDPVAQDGPGRRPDQPLTTQLEPPPPRPRERRPTR